MLLCYPVKAPPTRACRVGLEMHAKCRKPRATVQRHLPWRQPKEKVIPRPPPWRKLAMAVLGRLRGHQDTEAARLTLLGREWTLERPHSGSHPHQQQRELHVAVGKF